MGRSESTCSPGSKGKKRANGAMSIGYLGSFESFCFVRYSFSLGSIFLWQHEDRCRAIRFRENPYPVTGAGRIRGQNAKPLLD
jgi:hypothetical protein